MAGAALRRAELDAADEEDPRTTTHMPDLMSYPAKYRDLGGPLSHHPAPQTAA